MLTKFACSNCPNLRFELAGNSNVVEITTENLTFKKFLPLQLPQPVPSSHQIPNTEIIAQPKEVISQEAIANLQTEKVGEPLTITVNAKPDENQVESQMFLQETVKKIDPNDVQCKNCNKRFANAWNREKHENLAKCKMFKGQNLNRSLPINSSSTPMTAPQMPMTPVPMISNTSNSKKQIENGIPCKYCKRSLRIQNVKSHERTCAKTTQKINANIKSSIPPVGTPEAAKSNFSPQQPQPQQNQMVPVPPAPNVAPILPQKANNSQCRYCSGFADSQTLSSHEENCARFFTKPNVISGNDYTMLQKYSKCEVRDVL